MMTNATTVENNSTNRDQTNNEKCNQTANTDKETQNCVVNTLQKQSNHCSNNTNNNATNCETFTATDNNPKNNTKDNQVVDTVLKYLSKKGDKAEIPIKDKGHFKNSLRRKRSISELHDRSPLPSKFQRPIIVNYETLHGPGETVAPLRYAQNNILGANLADFNIETLHGNTDNKKKENIGPNLKKDSSEIKYRNDVNNERDYKRNDDNRKSSRESEESSERGDYKVKKSQHENENSGEHENYRNRKPSSKNQDSAEREDYKTSKSVNNSGERENYRNEKSSRENDDSAEHVEYKNRQSNLKEDSSGERGAYKNSDSSHERSGSRESGVYKDSESSRRRDDNDERGDYKNKSNNSGDTYHSAESTESSPKTNSRYSSRNKNNKQSSESDENRKSDPNSAESKESIETDDRDKRKYDGVQDIRKNAGYHEDARSHESPFLDDSKYKKIETYPKKNLDSSNESSDEGYENNKERGTPQQNYKTDTTIGINNSSSVPLRDIDLNDFSYERIQVNKDGKVEPLKDNLEHVDPNTAVEILPLSTATPDLEIKKHEMVNSLTGANTLATPEIKTNGNKLIHIDDGEVKPVVEINPESESSEENAKSNVSDEVESLESILGVKSPENLDNSDNGQNDKIVEQKEVSNGDVKQEFERIPVNYNHAKETENKDSQTTEIPKEETEVTKKDSTIDVFAPEDVKYDENLNFKFDDLTIKLPEIKLPDDILAYTKEISPYSVYDDKKKTKPDVPSYEPSYYYDHDDREKTRESKDKEDDDDSTDDDDDRVPDTGYYGYFGDNEKKQNYKKKNDEPESDEEDDLYEKFVRERFGKQGTFEKRSEKLEAVGPTNPELYKTIKTILKKTADIDEQAKKSGDPKAGYMWTLEYGEKV